MADKNMLIVDVTWHLVTIIGLLSRRARILSRQFYQVIFGCKSISWVYQNRDDLVDWLLECTHFKEFREWMKNNYSHIHVLYIPENCTSIYQHADVILQRPFKYIFRQEFNKYTMSMIISHIETTLASRLILKCLPWNLYFVLGCLLHGYMFAISKRWLRWGKASADYFVRSGLNFKKNVMIQNMKSLCSKNIQAFKRIQAKI